MSVHEGIKFDCPHCEIKLANPSSLQRHIQKIHIEKRVRVCGNRFVCQLFTFNIDEYLRSIVDFPIWLHFSVKNEFDKCDPVSN